MNPVGTFFFSSLTSISCIIQALNGVWTKIQEHGGVGQVAKVFGLSEADVWSWVDLHEIPELYLRYLMGPGELVSDVQLSSSGYEDPVSGECWPGNWKLEPSDVNGPIRTSVLTG